MNTCTEFRHLLLLYAGEDLEPAQLEAVREHIEACASCASVTSAARRARDAYRAGSIGVAEREIDLWPAIRARIRAEAAALAGPASSLVPARPAPVRSDRTHQEPATRTERVPVPTTGRLLRMTAGLAAAAAVVLIARPFLTVGSQQGGATPVTRGVPAATSLVQSAPVLSAPHHSPSSPSSADLRASIEPYAAGSAGSLVAAELGGPLGADAAPGGLKRVDDPTQPSLREILGPSGAGALQWLPIGPEPRIDGPGDPFTLPSVPASHQRRVH